MDTDSKLYQIINILKLKNTKRDAASNFKLIDYFRE